MESLLRNGQPSEQESRQRLDGDLPPDTGPLIANENLTLSRPIGQSSSILITKDIYLFVAAVCRTVCVAALLKTESP